MITAVRCFARHDNNSVVLSLSLVILSEAKNPNRDAERALRMMFGVILSAAKNLKLRHFVHMIVGDALLVAQCP